MYFQERESTLGKEHSSKEHLGKGVIAYNFACFYANFLLSKKIINLTDWISLMAGKRTLFHWKLMPQNFLKGNSEPI